MPALLNSYALAVLIILADPQPCLAYLGPGLSAGTMGVVLGLIASVFLAIFAIIWYPFKRLFRLITRGKKTAAAKASEKK